MWKWQEVQELLWKKGIEYIFKRFKKTEDIIL